MQEISRECSERSVSSRYLTHCWKALFSILFPSLGNRWNWTGEANRRGRSGRERNKELKETEQPWDVEKRGQSQRKRFCPANCDPSALLRSRMRETVCGMHRSGGAVPKLCLFVECFVGGTRLLRQWKASLHRWQIKITPLWCSPKITQSSDSDYFCLTSTAPWCPEC